MKKPVKHGPDLILGHIFTGYSDDIIPVSETALDILTSMIHCGYTLTEYPEEFQILKT